MFTPIDDHIRPIVVCSSRGQRLPILGGAVEHTCAKGVHAIRTKLGQVILIRAKIHSAFSSSFSRCGEGAAEDGAGFGDGVGISRLDFGICALITTIVFIIVTCLPIDKRQWIYGMTAIISSPISQFRRLYYGKVEVRPR